MCLQSEKEGLGVFEDVIMAGCQAALRFFLFSLLLCFDVEAESRTDSVTVFYKKQKIVVEENFLRQNMIKGPQTGGNKTFS